MTATRTISTLGNRSKFHPSSFRDQTCWVESVGSVVTRKYSSEGATALKEFVQTKAWNILVERNLIDKPLEIALDSSQPYTIHRCIKNWTYPYEWSQSMLQQAALKHLEVTEVAGQSGWTTKDASSFNLVYDQGSFTFVDIGSFVRRKTGEPWWAYQEFCEHFLFPLMVGAYVGLSHGKVTRSSVGRLPLADAAKMLRRFPNKPGVLQHVLLPAKLSKKDDSVEEGRDVAKRLPGDPHQNIVKSLQKIIKKMASKSIESVWSDYSDRLHYDKVELTEKRRIVNAVVDRLSPTTVIDLGGNDGNFSSSLDAVESVLVADFSEDVIDNLFLSDPKKNILPVVLDICNPTPALGWANQERSDFFERIKPDLVLMLAVVHHLAISSTIPFREIASWCESTGASIVVEFVDRKDQKVQHLLARKVDDFPYSQEGFLQSFESHGFEKEFLGQVSTTRSLWLFK